MIRINLIAKADNRVAEGLPIIIRTAATSTTSAAFVTYFLAYFLALDGNPALEACVHYLDTMRYTIHASLRRLPVETARRKNA